MHLSGFMNLNQTHSTELLICSWEANSNSAGQEMLAFYGARVFITMLIGAHQWSLSWAKWIQSTTPFFNNKMLTHFSTVPCVQHAPPSWPTTHHGGVLEEMRYSSYSFLISVLDGGEWSASCPGRASDPGRGPPVPTVQEKSFASAGDRTPIAGRPVSP
jgi:hypothetical protein